MGKDFQESKSGHMSEDDPNHIVYGIDWAEAKARMREVDLILSTKTNGKPQIED